MKGNGDEDDGTYDWMLLNSEKGWESTGVSDHRVQVRLLTPRRRQLPRMPVDERLGHGQKRSTRIEWNGCAAAQQECQTPLCETSVVMSHRSADRLISKQRKSGPTASAMPNASNQAIVGVSAPSPLPGSRRQSQQGHPFASVNAAAAQDRGDASYDPSTAPIPSQAGMQPITPMTINGRPGNTAANSQQLGEGDFQQEPKRSNGFLRILTCGCCR